jgi:predicted kinase
MTLGLPRSGKTTWSKQQGVPIVCPDAIRLALHGERFIGSAEPFVWAIAKCMVRALFVAGHGTVILDATNVTKKRRDEWKSDEWTRAFKVITTPTAECLRRAEAEGDTYIVPVIERMAAEWEIPSADEQPWIVIDDSLEADALARYGLTAEGHIL